MAPTGSGKTLAAFLAGLDALVRRAVAGALDDACASSTSRRSRRSAPTSIATCIGPLRGIEAHALRARALLPPIRTALRTGDTTQTDRARILRRPPHVLITTPESLYLLLTSAGGRAILGGVETVIVDEIHALVGNKRGAHLALSLERLDALVRAARAAHRRLLRRPSRRACSASACRRRSSPGARRRASSSASARRRGARLRARRRRARAQPLDLAIEVPKETLAAVASRSAWGDVYERIAPHRRAQDDADLRAQPPPGRARGARSRGAELAKAWSRRTTARSPSGRACPSSGGCRAGELRAVVATASLELGIDIGARRAGLSARLAALDRGVAPAHRPRAPRRRRHAQGAHLRPHPRRAGRVRGRRARDARGPDRSRRSSREAPLDILAQQLVATARAPPTGDEDELFALVRARRALRALPRARVRRGRSTCSATAIATRRGRSGAHLHLDRVNGRVRGRRGARLAALTSGGAIPDKADYIVVEDPTEAVVGTLDEDFAIETMAGDIFLLGSTSWRIRRVETAACASRTRTGCRRRCRSGTARGWRAPRSCRARWPSCASDLAGSARASRATRDALARSTSARSSAAAPSRRWTTWPRARTRSARCRRRRRVVAERFFDDSGGMQLVIHAPFGARINRAWGLALRKKFCRTFDFELQAAATDDAILLSIGPQHSFPLDSIFGFVTRAQRARDVLCRRRCSRRCGRRAGAGTRRARWRCCAITGGKRTPPPLLRMRAADLLAAVFPARRAARTTTAA